MQNELLGEGLTLMLAGMGTVFVFLTTLVIIMSVASRLILRLVPEAQTADQDEEIAAITAAIRKHRNR